MSLKMVWGIKIKAITVLLTLITFKVALKAETLLSHQKWEDCKHELLTKGFPRNCMVTAVMASKKGYDPYRVEIEGHCLKHIKGWRPIDPADEVILKQYYKKCFYRLKQLEAKESPLIEELDVIKEDLVRFLYLND